MYLFFDTETTGVPRNFNAPASDTSAWPRIVQIAWLLADKSGNELSSAAWTIRPEGFSIPKSAARIHGITHDVALRDGVSLRPVLDDILKEIGSATKLVAHNMQFDERVLGAELLRAGYSNVLGSKPRLCTMRSATNFCALPGPYGYKWPSLQELHLKLFGEAFDGAHAALADVKACAKCFFELKRLKCIE